MQNYLQGTHGLTETGGGMRPMVTAFLKSAILPSRANTSIRNQNELATLAQALDFLIVGKVAQAADILTRRFQAVDAADMDGSWARARHLEIVDHSRISSISEQDMRRATRKEKDDIRFKKDVLSMQSGGRPGGIQR